MMTVAQQKAGQLLAGLPQGANRGQTRTHQIADRLMRRIWNPDRGQLTGSVQGIVNLTTTGMNLGNFRSLPSSATHYSGPNYPTEWTGIAEPVVAAS